MSTLAAKLPPDAQEVPAPDGGKKSKIKVLALVLLVLLLGAASATWLLLPHKAEDKQADKHQAEAAPSGPPVFVPLEPFTVNLQPDGQFLQATFTLQMASQEESNNLKVYMPQVRSRMLLMLSNKTVIELSTVDGKTRLGSEIARLVEQPFAAGLKPVRVSNVFFTSFVIQ